MARAPDTANTRYPFFILLGAILCLSLLPPAYKDRLHSEGKLHGIGHLLAFAALAFFAMQLKCAFYNRLSMAFSLLMFAFSIELVENLIWHYPFEWRDIRTDSMGITVGWLLASIIARTQPQ